MLLSFLLWVSFSSLAVLGKPVSKNSTYTNPMLPGWHSDPSCVFVPEKDNTHFCVTSTFIAFPGLPIYASKDLQNWKLISNALNRPSQISWFPNTTSQQGGVYAPTLRYHDGKFYLITAFFASVPWGAANVLFTSTDPYSDVGWSDPLQISLQGYDPDIFFDDDGSSYFVVADGPMQVATLNTITGQIGNFTAVWNGTGGAYPEGPHMYKKDGYYYLMIAEGGTELGHSETIARSRHILGPYESNPANPILTNRNTTEYFQTVGHADLFKDASGNWWGVALSTRSGPEWVNYPMGRETVLYPVSWPKGQWPIAQPVRGVMSGWALPPISKALPGSGPFVEDPDFYTFAPGTSIPKHFVYWRLPDESAYIVSPKGHPNSLGLHPSTFNLTGTADFQPYDPITLIMRRQTDTLFTYSLDFSFKPTVQGEEAGISLFLTQSQHIDLGIVLLPSSSHGTESLDLYLRFRVTGTGNYNGTPIATKVIPVSQSWERQPIRLQIQAISEKEYVFSASSVTNLEDKIVLGHASATIVSGGTGPFTGSLVGAYATSNGGSGTTPAYVTKWVYQPQGQAIADGIVVPSYKG